MPDALTGLATTRELAARIATAGGYALWIDIDGLIWFNDRSGHAAGDNAILTVAQALRDEPGSGGRDLHRVGGDEFIVLTDDGDASAAIALAMRLRDRVDALAIPYARPDRPQADCLRINVAVFAIDAPGVADSLRGARFDDPWQGRLADAVYAEKCRLGEASGVVVFVAD